MSAAAGAGTAAGDGRPLVELEACAFGYRGRAVVSGVDLVVRRGDFLCIAGPNGAGKTTLFRGILGLIAPLGGTCRRATRAIGYVPQRDRLDDVFPLTVEELVTMGAFGRLRGLRGVARDDRALVGEALAEVGLADRRRAPFSSLSGGQRQRALIARALVARPEILLLDEPTRGVDRPTERRVLELLTGLCRERGLAVLLVTHQLDVARAATREALWVADGRVLRGPAAELLAPERLEQRLAGAAAEREER